MIDSARHYLPVRAIKRIIDSMAWIELIDDHCHKDVQESFPIAVPYVPELWMGSFTGEERYSHWDIEEVVAYAKERGILVVPEFDIPGHGRSWCVGSRALFWN